MAQPKKNKKGLYTMTVTVTEGGKKVRKFFRGKTVAEVRQRMLEYQEKAKMGRTFEEVADSWQDAHWGAIKPGTQVSYRPALNRALETFGNDLIADIKPLDVQRSVSRMADQGYAHHSVVIYRSVLNQIFDHAVLESDIDVNPTVAVKIPKGLSKKNRECPEDKQLDLINAGVNLPFGLFAYILRYTGMRRGELLALQWKDIDFVQHRIHVTKNVSYAAGNKPIITTPKTAAGTRSIILVNRLENELRPIQGKPEDYIFGGSAPLTGTQYSHSWRRYCLDAGLWTWKEDLRTDKDGKKTTVMIRVPNVTPHQLRHAYATMCYDLGIDPKDTQRQLGHSKLEVTMDTYTHISVKRELEVERLLNKA